MNTDDYLHTHIEARYDWEPEENKFKPSWCNPSEKRYTDEYEFTEERYGNLKRDLTEALKELMQQKGYYLTIKQEQL